MAPVRVDRGDQRLPARAQGSRRLRALEGGAWPGGLRHVRRGGRAPGARAGPAHRPPPGRAAQAHRLQDRDHAPGRRGRRAIGAQRAGPRRVVCRAGRHRRARGPGRRPRRPDPLRRLRADDLLHPWRTRLGQGGQGHRRRGRGQGHAPSQRPGRGHRGDHHAPRHHRRSADDRPDRLQGADTVQGRLVRQRHVARRPVGAAPAQVAQAGAAARRSPGEGGLRRLLRGRRPGRRRHRRALPGRDQPAGQRRHHR